MNSILCISSVALITILLPHAIDAQAWNGIMFTSINCTDSGNVCNSNENCESLSTLDPPCKSKVCVCKECGKRPGLFKERCSSVKYVNKLGDACKDNSDTELWEMTIPRSTCDQNKVICLGDPQANGCTAHLKSPCKSDGDCMGYNRRCDKGKCVCSEANEVFNPNVGGCRPRAIGDSCSKNAECATQNNFMFCQNNKCACDTTASVEIEMTTLDEDWRAYVTRKVCANKVAKVNQPKGSPCTKELVYLDSASGSFCEKSLVCYQCLEEDDGKCRKVPSNLIKSAESCGAKRFVFNSSEKATVASKLIIAVFGLIHAAL